MSDEYTMFPVFPSHITKPLPCPGCCDDIEFEDELHCNGSGPPPSYQIRCGTCGAAGPYGQGSCRGDHDGGKNEAVKAWNEMPRRAVI